MGHFVRQLRSYAGNFPLNEGRYQHLCSGVQAIIMNMQFLWYAIEVAYKKEEAVAEALVL